MKFFINLCCIILLVTFVASERRPQTVQDVENLLNQIDAEEEKITLQEPTMGDAVKKLFGSFKQMTLAYLDVLNAVNLKLGLPKYPKIPGLTREQLEQTFDDTEESGLNLVELRDNLNVLQKNAIDIGRSVQNAMRVMNAESRSTVFQQFKTFAGVWSKQLHEIENVIDNDQINSGDQAESRQDTGRPNIVQQIQKFFNDMTKNIQQFTKTFTDRVRQITVRTTTPKY